jgi:hypothetical protein
MLVRLDRAFQNYKGRVSWIRGLSSESTPICLLAVRGDSGRDVTGYPLLDANQIGSLLAGLGGKQVPLPSEEFINQAVDDVANLTAYVEQYLELKDVPAKELKPADYPPSPDDESIDFVEHGMHVVWIIQKDAQGESTERRFLHFGVTENEWNVIRTTFLGLTSTSAGTSQFPLLSKIDPHDGAYFKRADVSSLRREILLVRSATRDILTMNGLDKLILICNWADHMSADILFRAR